MKNWWIPFLCVIFATSCSQIARKKEDSSVSRWDTKRKFAGKTCRNNGDPLFCMVCNIYAEARGEPYEGKLHVGKTVLTRAKSGAYPKDLCGVIYQRKQFSWANRGKKLPLLRDNGLHESHQAALQALAEGPNGLTHFHNHKVRPQWPGCEVTTRVGRHTFYKCPLNIRKT